jgi:phosphoribosyl 1,2-cyclic phosphodiesterase
VRVCLLASGSKGNSLFVEAGQTRLLVDAGLAAREILRRLAEIGISPAGLDAILITHEHADHIRGAGTLARKLKIPVFLSAPTLRASGECFKNARIVEFESGSSFIFRDLLFDPFPITHDASDPVGFIIECGDGRVGVATDLGIGTRLVADKLKGCGALVLESNHDEEMLLNGPYPWHLKQRIKSRHGHLSNRDSAALLGDIAHDGLAGVFLAHISEVNNDPRFALDAARSLFDDRNTPSPRLIVGNQYRVSEVLTI